MSYLDETRGIAGISYEDVSGDGNDDNPDYGEERRLAEEIWKQRKAEGANRSRPPALLERYANFLAESREVNVDNLSANADSKRAMLVKYFPKHFGVKSAQSVYKRDAAGVGKQFKEIVRSAKRALERHSPDPRFYKGHNA